MSDEELLILGMCESPEDDLPRLVYADWVDEHGRDTGRWRQWIALRRKIREELEGHTGEDDRFRFSEVVETLPDWLKRCYAADVGRYLDERWPIKWGEIRHKDAMKWKATIEHTRLIAELYACNLVGLTELNSAECTSYAAASSETYASAYSAAWSADELAEFSPVNSVEWSVSKIESYLTAYSIANRYAELVETFARTL